MVDRLDRILAGYYEPETTPPSTVEAVLLSVRARGLAALQEPATQERLSRCDAEARAQINSRIIKLIEAGRLREEKPNAA